MSFVSLILLSLGVFFWFFGTLALFINQELITKLHFLGISDTLGSALIVLGMLVHSPESWPLLILVLITSIAWGPVLTHMIARGIVWKRRR
ncbi:MAG: sodium:proton antiporter [Thermotogae bacterium]|nr:MAG: sodium:proton antiporter [Thermotogota bacterium]